MSAKIVSLDDYRRRREASPNESVDAAASALQDRERMVELGQRVLALRSSGLMRMHRPDLDTLATNLGIPDPHELDTFDLVEQIGFIVESVMDAPGTA